MDHPLPRLRGLFESGMRQQVTRTGLLYTLAMVIVGFAAFASSNNLLFLILAAMLATLLMSNFISRLSLAGLELEFLHPEHIAARRKIAGRVVVHNEKHWMPSFSIQLAATPDSGFRSVLYFAGIPAGARLEEAAELYFARRGRYRENTFYFSTRFPFGFTERRIPVRVRQDLVVYPSVDPQRGFEALLLDLTGEIDLHFRGRGHDFYRIRPYEALESARHVDWKATAHTGELQVREFAREQEQSIAIFFDLDASAGSVFEAAVDCAAYLVWQFAQRGARVRFFTQEFTLRLPEEGDVYAILKYLALVSPAHGRAAPPPDDPTSFQVLLSGKPERLSDAGWAPVGASNVFVLRPDRLAVADAGAADAAGDQSSIPAEGG
jgi:uncharacterized protein (DUF58 family)